MIVNAAEEIIEFKGNKRPIGGGINYSHLDFTNQSYELQEGDEVFLYTDGIIDQIGGPDGKKFKSRRFKELVQNTHFKPVASQEAFVRETIQSWQGEQFQIDDMMIVGIRI
jgi:serine phosphatase RsbU (regulator of sigma subunit)